MIPKLKLYHYCLLYILLFASCTVYHIHVEKKIVINGQDNATEMQGSDLDDVEGSPDNKPDVTLPVYP